MKNERDSEEKRLEDARRIDDLIKNSGMSAYRISQMCGVDQAIISKLRNGQRKPKNLRYETAYLLAQCLGVSI